jgi:predicted NACHT family NTPase
MLRGAGDDRRDPPSLAELIRPLAEAQVAEVAKAVSVSSAALRAAAAPLTPLEALHTHRQIVIVGEPGSGKSMLTQRMAALLAAAGSEERSQLADLSEDERSDLQELLAQLGRRLLPVRIVLSRWKRALRADGQPLRDACADDLIDACVDSFGATASLAAFKERFVLTRLSGDAPTALILLDGLDEVSDAGQRAWQLAAVSQFCRRFARVPLLVTCRVRPYRAWQQEWQANGGGLPLLDFPLADLSDDAKRRFIARWYAELQAGGVYTEAGLAAAAQERLAAAIFDAARPNHAELYKMAGTPLLLTMMAHVNYRLPLPDSRAALYAEFVDQLLYKWEELRLAPGQKTQISQQLAAVGSDLEPFKLALAGLAYDRYQAAASRDLVDIPKWQFLARLSRLPRIEMSEDERAAWATRLLAHITARSGLLVTPDDDTLRFSHLSLQEYMTATKLLVGFSDDKLRAFDAVIDKPLWNEVVQLGLGTWRG